MLALKLRNDTISQVRLPSRVLASGLKYLHSQKIFPSTSSKLITIIFTELAKKFEEIDPNCAFDSTIKAREFLNNYLSSPLNPSGRGEASILANIQLEETAEENAPSSDDIKAQIAKAMKEMK